MPIVSCPPKRSSCRWIETRTPSEQALYPHINSIARGVIAEAFSSRVITPGVTTTEVAWYIRERFESLGLRPWFMATVDRQRAGQPCPVGARVGTAAMKGESRRAMSCTRTSGFVT